MEYDLLCTLAKNRNIALEREKLLNAIWGIDFEGETRTVDVHVAALRKKTGLRIVAVPKDWISSGGRRMRLRSRITIGTLGFADFSYTVLHTYDICQQKNMLNSTTSYTKTELEKLVANFYTNKSDIESTVEELTAETKLKYYFLSRRSIRILTRSMCCSVVMR